LLGDKPGDNAQVEAVAEALGWNCERKTLQWRARYAIRKPRFRATLDHLDEAASAPLEPPWPDLILTIGRRPSLVALWIKARSGARTRLVVFGKPSGMMDRFDLVVAGAEVQLPQRRNLVPIRLPLRYRPAPPADRHPGRRTDRAVRVRCAGERAAVPAGRRDRRCGRHALRHHQPPYAGPGAGRAAGRPAGRRAAV
jgi:hypothetical protein